MSETHLQLRCSKNASRYGAPSERQALLDEALVLYFKNTVHPPTDPARLVRLAQGWATGAELPNDVFWALRAMLFNAGDYHSYIVPSMERGAFYDMLTPTPPVVSLRDDGVAVVAVSQVGFDDDEGARRAYARNLFNAIARVAAKRPKGWIVDLRGFGGGDMWTTLTGLSALVGGPVVGEFVSQDGRIPWLVSPGRSGTTGNQDIVSIAPLCSTTDSGPLAVLIGPGTGSSGEATAIAFEGRPQTRFFGQPTLGIYNSGVVQYRLFDGTMFGIAQTLNADRNGHLRDGAIVPDVVVAASEDPLELAAAWLAAQRRE